MNKKTGFLPKNFSIDGKYSVLLFVQNGRNAQTYRVKGLDGNLYFLKLFDYARLQHYDFDGGNNLLEIAFLEKINHENIAKYRDSGEIVVENRKFGYLVLDFIAGETLSERISRQPFVLYYDIERIIADMLSGLAYLHTLSEPIVHNDITPANIMLDLSVEIPKARIIDFGHARLFHQSTKTYNRVGLDLNYVASECFNNLFSPQSDLYAVGAVMYQLLFGLPPWFVEISKFASDRDKTAEILLEHRNKPLLFPETHKKIIGYSTETRIILKKALSQNVKNRFQSAKEFLQALNGDISIENLDKNRKTLSNKISDKNIAHKKAKGFSAIAGMKDLKEQLQLDVIDALNHPEEYAKYGVGIPNGMLLYGPPGCGKTFFAKHFAEEVGHNFMMVTPSALKSRYVNATQENIAKMFADAEKNAPTIVFMDEINEIVPNRNDNVHEMSKSAVNEMLAQMDRTGEKGIFIIGATNYPDQIDPAMLRSGRLDKKCYLPPPDFEARKTMFDMYLKNRPLDFGIDYEKLAELTENYVSADIEFLANEASRLALRNKTRISMEIMEEIIKKTKPSVPLDELRKYEAIRTKMERGNAGRTNDVRPVGFRIKT